MVAILRPAAAEIGVMQLRTGAPSRCTVQAPHSAAPQPNLVPVIPSVSRRAHRMGVAGSASTAYSRPLMLSAIMAGRFSSRLAAVARHCWQHGDSPPAEIELDGIIGMDLEGGFLNAPGQRERLRWLY